MKPTNKLAGIKQDQADKALSSTRHLEEIAHLDSVGDKVLSATSSLIQYLEGHTSKTEVVNQLQSIATPDVEHVVKALEILDQSIKATPQTDLSGVTQLMQELLSEAQAIPKEHQDITIPQPVDNTKQLSSLLDAVKAVEKVVKAQKLIAEAPIVNVPETSVHVDAPDLQPLQSGFKEVVTAVKGIVIPEFKTDNAAVEKLLKDVNKLLDKILKKPISSGGGGGSSWTAIGTNGLPAPLNLTSDGKLIVDAEVTVPPITVDTAPTFSENPTDPTPTPAFGLVDADGVVQVAVVSGEAPVTNDGTFAKETGGNLDTIAAKDFATQTTLALIKAKTDNIDVALSTRLKPADTLTKVTTVDTITNVVHIDDNSGSITVDATSLPLPAGASTSAKQLPDNHNVVVTSAPTTAITAAALPLPSGASTSALQTSGNASLTSIDGKLSGPLTTTSTTQPQPDLPSSPLNNQKTVTTAGTRVQLQTNTLKVGIIIQALSTNTGLIYVGDSSVSSSNGFELQPGQATSVGVSNTNALWIDASVNGSKVCFIAS